MSATVGKELICEALGRMQDILALHTQYHLETRESLGLLEYQVGGLTAQYASLSNRLDRVEKRLELTEA